MPINSSWYASVASAALAYHLGGFVLLLAGLARYGNFSLIAENLYVDSLQALGCVALGAVCRTLSEAVRRKLTVASRVVIGDVCVVAFGVAGVAAVAVPLDSSGAALFGIILFLIWGVPAVALLSAFSILVGRYPWLQALLVTFVVLNATALMLGVGFRLAN